MRQDPFKKLGIRPVERYFVNVLREGTDQPSIMSMSPELFKETMKSIEKINEPKKNWFMRLIDRVLNLFSRKKK